MQACAHVLGCVCNCPEGAPVAFLDWVLCVLVPQPAVCMTFLKMIALAGELRDRPGEQMHLCSSFLVLVPRGRTSPQGNGIRIITLLRVATVYYSFRSGSG